MDYDRFLSILKEELVPALGCTEPIAIAYASAVCRKLLDESPLSTIAECSGNIIKNVKGVIVPNCGGLKGIDTAVAAGLLAGNSSKGLEVLADVDSDDIKKIEEYISQGRILVKLLESPAKLHIQISMQGPNHSASVEIKDEHTNIVKEVRDGIVVLESNSTSSTSDSPISDRSFLTVANIVEFAEKVPLSLIEPIIRPQIIDNKAICNEGLNNSWGAEVGRTVLETKAAGIMSKAEAMAAAGSDARMSGCAMPVVINSGSGNQGITVSIPVIVYAEEHNIEDEKLVRALAMSNLLAIYQKTSIGRLSAYCGAVSAACGAGAAISWLEGADLETIAETMTNTLATVSGMVCDGAKPSCAGKIATAVNAAFLAKGMAMKGRGYKAGDGIVKNTIENTVQSVGEVASKGMLETDHVILDVMLR